MERAGTTDACNTQPDEYQFNVGNLSGKFLYDHNGMLRFSSYSKVKIEKLIGSSNWDFKITGDDGTKYYFGGTGAIEKAKYENYGCPKNPYSVYETVAWHLKKVEYANGDFADYNYTNYSFSVPSGITQTITARSTYNTAPGGMAVWGSPPPATSLTTCQSIVNNQAVSLNSIVCSNGTSIFFGYANREDIIGEKAFEDITLYYSGEVVRRFKLNYIYSNSGSNYENGVIQNPPISFCKKRIFLNSIIDRGREGNNSFSTLIEYEDINGLPPRLSTAQDHFGYFNGKNNEYYFPKPDALGNELSVNSQSVGNRVVNNFNSNFSTSLSGNKEPDFNFAKKGSLKKITYPTGGTSTIEWEPNTVYKYLQNYPAIQTLTLNALGLCSPPSGSCSTVVYENINISYNQELILQGSAGTLNGEDPIHSHVTVNVLNLTTNELVYNNILSYNESFNYSFNLNSGLYKIELISTNNSIPGILKYSYRPGALNPQYQNINVPGLRVKSMTENDGMGNYSKTNYLYTTIDEPNKSTGQILDVRYYQNYIHKFCYGSYYENNPNQPMVIGQVSNNYDKIQSSTNYRAYTGGIAAINYTTVVETKGNNFSNGATEHLFITSYNSGGQMIYGNDIPNSPLSDNNFFSGTESETRYYINRGGQLQLRKKIINEYSADPRNFVWYEGYVVNMKNLSSIRLAYSPNDPTQLEDFDVLRYARYSSWKHLDKTTEYLYDELNHVNKTERTFGYENLNVLQPGSETTVGSDLSVMKKEYKFVPDYSSLSLSGIALASASNMMTNNLMDRLLQYKEFKNGILLTTNKTDYKYFSNNQNLPEVLFQSIHTADPVPRVRYNAYNDRGNVLEVQKENDIHFCYLWGYNSLYPILEAQNCMAGELYYNSFEDDSNAVFDENSKTGKKVWLNSYTVNFTKPNSKLYKISYHVWNGLEWVYSVQDYNSNSFLITGLKIDEIRIFPSDVISVNSFSYQPYIGVTSTCNANGKATYYEYDIFNRLAYIKDNEKKILKKYCYKYFSKPEVCQTTCTTTTAIWQNTSNTRCQTSSTCTYTGYQEYEQMDINPCSATFGEPQWIFIPTSYNPSLCTGSAGTMVTYSNLANAAGFTATYLNINTGLSYSFLIPPSGTGNFGCIPIGRYNLIISKANSSNDLNYMFGTGCVYVSGNSSANFNNVSISFCHNITIEYGQQEL